MKWIEIQNAHVHNLKHLNLRLQQRALIVLTGVSGSGKSSLAFDTLFVEGQRRYVESLSSSARRQLESLQKPAVDAIQGLSPTLSIEQKTVGRSPRSTVGTLTEIADYLRLLFARASTPHCPVSLEALQPQSPANIARQIQKLPYEKFLLLAPYARGKRGTLGEELQHLVRLGFTRGRLDGELIELTEPGAINPQHPHDLEIVVDRLQRGVLEQRLLESIAQCLTHGGGVCIAQEWRATPPEGTSQLGEQLLFATMRYSPQSGRSYPPLQPQDFSFNNPSGMCPRCQGLGRAQDWNLERAIDETRSIAQDACLLATSYQTVRYRNIYDNLAALHGFSVHTPWKHLSAEAKHLFLKGSDRPWITMQFVHPLTGKRWIDRVQWKGVLQEAWTRYQSYKTLRAKQALLPYLIDTICPECEGTRLKDYPRVAKLRGITLPEFCQLPCEEALEFAKGIPDHLSGERQMIAAPLVEEIERRLAFLCEVGLGYLNLDRPAPTLSGGESQRVRLASQVGCGLVGMTYILDEPSIGLHPIDNQKLIGTLRRLRDQGNTVIVVEHDEATICAADQVIDFGPKAGQLGGEVLFSGSVIDLIACEHSLTAQYMRDPARHLLANSGRKKSQVQLSLLGACHRNLQNVRLDIPLKQLVAIAGVSGSGKSSLVFEVLYPALIRALKIADTPGGHFRKLKNWESIQKVIRIDQSPIGRLPRSNPATYTKIFDEIRTIFSLLPESRALGFQPGRFSFNVAAGSCPHCQGMGWIEIDMEFAANEFILCATCQGRRFDEQTLSVRYRGKSIADVLDLSVGEAIEFFQTFDSLRRKLATLQKVGLDYLKLGQPSPQLSGGEAQRVKLARELAKPPQGHTLYLLDEPTTGLHAHDTMGLLRVLGDLVQLNHSVVVIEHHIDVLQNADYIVELGPGGGPRGGRVIAAGSPQKIARASTPTGQVLAEAQRALQISRRPPLPPATTSQSLVVEGARQNNLKGLTLTLPREKLIVFAGPSGSGKSSLAFETLYAEGQRRYVESLSPYARQFVQQLAKPHVDRIEGLSPAIAIEQKRHAGNPRSTVGTLTEIYEHLRLLYTRLGVAHCPETGVPLEVMTPQKLVEQLQKLPFGERIQVLAPVALRRGEPAREVLRDLLRSGFSRVRIDKEVQLLDFALIEAWPSKSEPSQFEVVVDRLKTGENSKRWMQSIEQALSLRAQRIAILRENGACEWFHMGFCSPRTGKSYSAIAPKLLSFNHAEGRCAECEGLGTATGIRFERHLPTNSITVRALLTLLWGKGGLQAALTLLEPELKKRGFHLKSSLRALTDLQKSWLLNGEQNQSQEWPRRAPQLRWRGIYPALTRLAKSGSLPLRLALSRYLEIVPCPLCRGARLNSLALGVRIGGVNLPELCTWPISRARAFVEKLNCEEKAGKSLYQTWREILARLSFLMRVGLEYLSLDRSAPTLSNGEAQRIRLSAQLGSQLTGVLYVLDEPTTGLHPFDSGRLGAALLNLRDLGNTVLVVEHDLPLMRKADWIVDFGPRAGTGGGQIVAAGTPSQICQHPDSPTGPYLSHRMRVELPATPAPRALGHIHVQKALSHNLKGFEARIPTPSLTCLTGVSGSGKSTLLKRVLMPAFAKRQSPGTHGVLGLEPFSQCLYIDQNPPGKTHRADVGTFVDVFAKLRVLFAALPESKIAGLTSSHFSPNTLRGMCRTCQGYGYRSIDLRFMAPLTLPCPECRGQRLNPLSLSVTYRGKTFGQLFEMTAAECARFFADHISIARALKALCDVGLDYLTLGQQVATLSGGEAQRLKLSEQLRKRRIGAVLYLLDEPTLGLHPGDVRQLLTAMRALVLQGHTVVCIEHNLHFIQCADWILDLGPGPGEFGGELVASGTVLDIIATEKSKTGQFLKIH